ncbi:hypothetical protein BH11MYX2_BH11MYX2_20140 [soil metagenome]
MDMDLSALGSMSSVQAAYTVKAAKLQLDTAKQQGQDAVQLIQAAAPPTGPEGQGTHVNTYA